MASAPPAPPAAPCARGGGSGGSGGGGWWHLHALREWRLLFAGVGRAVILRNIPGDAVVVAAARGGGGDGRRRGWTPGAYE